MRVLKIVATISFLWILWFDGNEKNSHDMKLNKRPSMRMLRRFYFEIVLKVFVSVSNLPDWFWRLCWCRRWRWRSMIVDGRMFPTTPNGAESYVKISAFRVRCANHTALLCALRIILKRDGSWSKYMVFMNWCARQARLSEASCQNGIQAEQIIYEPK